jgi:[ribosomal protein S18]-alanine N-acetyltransferase
LTFSIRPMTREDLDQVNDIDREAFPTQWPPPNYRQELQNRLARYLVVTDDSRTLSPPPARPPVLRRMASRLLPWLSHDGHKGADVPPAPLLYIAAFSGIWMMVDEAHITNIAVRKEYQEKGIGGLLLLATIDLSIELKAAFVTLEVRASNTVAQDLYSRYGFTQTGLRRGYYLDNREDALIMSTESVNSPVFKQRLEKLRASLPAKLGFVPGPIKR